MRAGSFAPCRAGGLEGNHLSHSSFMPAKSSSSARTTVTLATLSRELPASSKMARTLARHCAVCSWMVEPLIAPVAGSMGAVPETKTKPAALTAWLYVGGGLPALLVNTIRRVTVISLAQVRKCSFWGCLPRAARTPCQSVQYCIH